MSFGESMSCRLRVLAIEFTRRRVQRTTELLIGRITQSDHNALNVLRKNIQLTVFSECAVRCRLVELSLAVVPSSR